MDNTQAVREAARAVIEHGGPDCLTDPHIPLDAMGVALDAGATHEDIAAEMRRHYRPQENPTNTQPQPGG